MKRISLTCCLLVLVSACGSSVAGVSASSEALEQDRGRGSAFICDFLAILPPDLEPVIGQLEIDRVYKSSRPGFITELVPASQQADGLHGGILALFDTDGGAQAFSNFLAHVYELGGIPFWQRKFFGARHCQVWQLLGRVGPTAGVAEVNVRLDVFHLDSAGARGEWSRAFPALKAEAQRRGYASVALLYSEPDQLGAVLYSADVPQAARNLYGAPPIGNDPPLRAGADSTRSSWVIASFSPFEPGDHGAPSVWPMDHAPAPMAPTHTDGVCEVSRLEDATNSPSDCLPTCGNGVPDPGEGWWNCPGDVRQFRWGP